jgi:predicted DCC family thiol-disulfide oxidoreductase YuxK
MVTIGHFSKEDAEAVREKTDPGKEYGGLPQLCLTQRQTSISAEARAIVSRRGSVGEFEPWSAVVVTNPIIRVTTNFLVRIARNKRVRLFGNEVEPTQWLSARVEEEQKVRTASG